MFGNGKKEEICRETVREERSGFVSFLKYLCVIVATASLCRIIPEALETQLDNQRYVTLEYKRLESRLLQKEACFLCGENEQSMVGAYRRKGGMGVICLSDWHIIGFDVQQTTGTVFRMMNTGDVQIQKDSTASGRRVSVSLSWPEGMLPDTDLLEENLCQECLDKVTDTLSVHTKKYTEKIPAPFCAVDFETLKLYSVQDSNTTFSNGEYWVELSYSDNKMKLNSYYLPDNENRKFIK